MKKLLILFGMVTTLASASCNKDDERADLPADTPRTEVPDELVGAWENGYIDFAFWENYTTGHWAGRNAVPSREAMIFQKNGEAKFYRYEFARNLYEELIDCTGTVAFHDDGTFTFYPKKGRKRFNDLHHPENSKDRALTTEELSSAKLGGKRGFVYDGDYDPPRIKIMVPSSAPYYWYKKQ